MKKSQKSKEQKSSRSEKGGDAESDERELRTLGGADPCTEWGIRKPTTTTTASTRNYIMIYYVLSLNKVVSGQSYKYVVSPKFTHLSCKVARSVTVTPD